MDQKTFLQFLITVAKWHPSIFSWSIRWIILSCNNALSNFNFNYWANGLKWPLIPNIDNKLPKKVSLFGVENDLRTLWRIRKVIFIWLLLKWVFANENFYRFRWYNTKNLSRFFERLYMFVSKVHYFLY